MFRKSLILGLSFAGFMSLGACSMDWHETWTMTATLKSQVLKDQCKVSLQHRQFMEKHNFSVKQCNEQLLVEISRSDAGSQELILKTVEHPSLWGAETLRYPSVEAHADKTRHKAWFVNGWNGRVLATYDMDGGKATGPDDNPPDWVESKTNEKPPPKA